MQQAAQEVRSLKTKVGRIKSQISRLDKMVARDNLQSRTSTLDASFTPQLRRKSSPSQGQLIHQVFRAKFFVAESVRATSRAQLRERGEHEAQLSISRRKLRDAVLADRSNLSLSKQLRDVERSILRANVQLSKRQ